MKRNIQLLPPDDLTGLELEPAKDRAAGSKAVTIALQHIAEEMGLGKGLKLLNRMNQEHGFDCPGCAWPDPLHRSRLGEYCENGAKAIAEEATDKKCDPAFFAKNDVETLSRWSDYQLGKSGRITQPMVLKAESNTYVPISWPDAFERIAEALKACDPNRAVFYTSGRTSNETAFLYQTMVRMYGTNNLPDCSNMCHESSSVALLETMGIGKGSVTLQDIYKAEVILVMGQNPGTNHPRMLTALQKNKKNGGTIVHVNPLPEAGTLRFVDPQSPVEVLKGGTKLADHFLQVRIGGDIALLKLIMFRLLELEEEHPGTVLDRPFIEEKTEGYEAMEARLKTLDKTQALLDCGVSESDIEIVAQLLARKQRIIICWAMGLTQHVHGVANVQEIVNLLLMKGSIGKPGAGTCPVRGHSNVQGDRTMGVWEKAPDSFLDSMDERFQMQCPREHGYDVVAAIEAMEAGKVDVFFAMGGNFISATPDSERTAKAVQNCKLTVQVSTKLNRSHVVTGSEAIILPCLGRSEKDMQKSGQQFQSVENAMGIVHTTRGMGAPASTYLKSEVAIVAALGKALLGPNKLDWDACEKDYNLIRAHIEAVIPGFEKYNERIRHPQGFYLPNGPRQGQFKTVTGKGKFTCHDLPDVRVAEDELIMMTIRSHDQYNTTIYGLNDRYRGVKGERRVVLMHPDDIAARGLLERQLVNLKSHMKGVTREVRQFHVVPFDITRGCCATYFPEANPLIPLEHKAKRSHTPASKFVPITVEVV